MPSGLANSVFLNVQANTVVGARRINMGILFTNHKLPFIYSVSIPISRSKAIADQRPSHSATPKHLGIETKKEIGAYDDFFSFLAYSSFIKVLPKCVPNIQLGCLRRKPEVLL